jgi:mono/diheme cytochrome c family protein
MRFTSLILSSLFFLLQAIPAQAMPAYARLYKQQYGYMPSCHACHTEGGGTPINNFGKAFKDNGKNAAALSKIANWIVMAMVLPMPLKRKPKPMQVIKTQHPVKQGIG